MNLISDLEQSKNCKETTCTQNKVESAGQVNYAPDHQTPIPGTTLQRTVPPKIEITITRQQLIAVTRLFKQYGKPKPGWLRQKFYINQRRRKCLNNELLEAQLDKMYCGKYRNTEEWDALLHLLWHNINGVPSCV